ncbi:MAG: carboxylesterase family protein [Croceibacterium sp.]
MKKQFRQPIASRREVLVGGCLIGAGLTVPSAILAQSGPTLAETTNGRVRGFRAGGVIHFRGIPYGGDTGGNNRFMPPTPVARWSGVRVATEWGHVSPQPPDANKNPYGLMTGWSNFRGGMGEDCLNVNVWTPALDAKKRAVMVMLHGGGFTSGSGNLVALEGQYMARAGDVVVVNVNHRLGSLGYADLSAFGGPDLAKSGNVGMLDIVQALEWVRNNIENFGGDPKRVALSGQSGGGGKVSTLFAMPSAAGLFHRAVVQSGSTLRVATADIAQGAVQQMLDKLGIAKGDLAKLRSLPFEQIIAAQVRPGPVVDGVVLPRQPFDPDAPAISADVPMVIGTCLEDWSFAMPDQREGADSLREYVEQQAPGHGAEVLQTYQRRYPDKRPYLIKAIVATDIAARRNASTQALRKAAQDGARAYVYRWDWPIPGGEGHWGAVHGSDLSLSMSNPTTAMTLNTPQAQVMSRKIGQAIIAFTKSGNPNCGVVPNWPPYEAKRRSVMVFDTNTRVVQDPERDIRLMWDRIKPA